MLASVSIVIIHHQQLEAQSCMHQLTVCVSVTGWGAVMHASVSMCAVAHSLDVGATSAGAKNGSSLQLNAFHCLVVQHHRLVLLVVEALVAISVCK